MKNCFNGIQDWGETGIDQGGNCTTITESCFDGILNGDETGVDTGVVVLNLAQKGMTGTWPNCLPVFIPKPSVNFSLDPIGVSYGGSTTFNLDFY